MESSWIPPTSSANRRSRPAVSALARGRARCCRSRKSVVTARNVAERRGMARPRLDLRDDVLGERPQPVPAVRVLRGGAQRAFLTLSADPDRHPWLQRLGEIRRVLEPEVLALKIRAATFGIEQQAQALRVLLEHVLAHADAREIEAERLGL